MIDDLAYIFHIGEAYDDVSPAFWIDGRAYSDAASLRADLQAARRALEQLRLISEMEATSTVPGRSVPSWEQWRQRHLVEGQPLAVRPSPGSDPEVAAPLEELRVELVRVHDRLHSTLLALAETVPGRSGRPYISSDVAPRRSGRGSVDRFEERYATEVTVAVPVDLLDASVQYAFDRLRDQGWQPVDSPARTGDTPPPELAVERVDPGGQTTCRVTILTHHRDRVLLLSGRSLPRTPTRSGGDSTSG